MGRRTYRKGSRSRTRRGHKNFETYKGSKRYSEKRFKRKFGRKTGRAPFFPFAGGMTKSQGKMVAVDDLIGGSRMRHSYRRRRPHFRTYRRKKRSHYNRRRSHRNRKHRRSKKQKKSRRLFAFLFS